MKPTETHISDLHAVFMRHRGGMLPSLVAALEYWESIRPADEPDRWIPLSERRPTAEDADETGCVLVFSSHRDVWRIKWDTLRESDCTHWKRTNLPQPTADKIEAKEIRAAYEDDDSVGLTFDSFKAGWLACKSKTAKP